MIHVLYVPHLAILHLVKKRKKKMMLHPRSVIDEVVALKKDGLSYRLVGLKVGMTTNQVLGIIYREHQRIQREMGAGQALIETGMDVAVRDTRPSLPFVKGLSDTVKYKMEKQNAQG
jgi:hypothetical protein